MNINILNNNTLFSGLSDADIDAMVACLGAYEKTYKKNEAILHEGDPVRFVGIVLSGEVNITKTDYSGNEMIIAQVIAGDLFAEVFACARVDISPVSIIATQVCRILFFDYHKMITTCGSSCKFHQAFIANMLQIVARKSLYLNQRIDIISKRTLREKILAYLFYESKGMQRVTLSHNREAMAKILCADRSALSGELSKMRREGLLDYHKNHFTIHDAF